MNNAPRRRVLVAALNIALADYERAHAKHNYELAYQIAVEIDETKKELDKEAGLRAR